MSLSHRPTPLLLQKKLLSFEKELSELELLDVVQLLIANEKAPGGPYYTWIVNPNDRTKYPEIDIPTNRSVQFFLARHMIHLDPLDAYLLENNSESVLDTASPQLLNHENILRIIDKTREHFFEFSEPMRNQLEECLKKFLQDQSCDEIIILPLQVQQSIHSFIKINLSTTNLDDLCVASLLLWISYTLYDGIMDKEKQISFIPLANQCVRQFIEIIRELPRGSHLYPLLNRLLTVTDEALLSEILGMRSVHIEPLDISDKSIPHALCTLAVIAHTDHSERTHNMFHIEKYFQYYLTARQLHDDAHDWLEDWQRGYINPIASLLFLLWKKEYCANQESIPTIEHNTKDLQRIFWTTGLDQSIILIRQYLADATKELSLVTCLESNNPLNSLIGRLETGCIRALADRDSKNRFLNEYRKSF